MLARYDGKCPGCGDEVIANETEIVNDDGQWVCLSCADVDDDQPTWVGDGAAEDVRDAASFHRFKQVVGTVPVEDDAFAVLASDAGESVKPRKRASKKPTPHADLHADRYERYTLVGPDGKKVVVSRASTVIKALADTYNLNQWKQACVLRGAARRPDLATLLLSLNPDDFADKARIKALVKDAEEAGGSKTSANLGTAVHAFCEKVDTDPGFLYTDIPAAHRADVVAYIAAMHKAGIGVIPDMVERTTMTPEWGGIGGTFDRIYRLADGRYVIADLKTGKVGYDPPEMYGQFAVYQDGVMRSGVYDRKGPDGKFPGTWTKPDFDVDRDLAIIVHLPAGQGKCVLHEADLSLGRKHLDRCARIRAERREKHYLKAYAPGPTTVPGDHVERWAATLQASPDVDTARMTWQIIVACGLATDELRSLAGAVATRFK